MALLEALKSPAFYVGALGSGVNSQRRRERLMEHFDLSQAEVDRLHGPVGIPIGSKTPPEIAVSILAEMTAVRNCAWSSQSCRGRTDKERQDVGAAVGIHSYCN
jgi:xanthine dehydrogenase accessory factor